MDTNLKKLIQDMKEKQKTITPTIDSVQLERCLREFKTELYIKRDEVNQLRTELDASNLEMQNLRRTLNATKRNLDENQFNLSLSLKKARSNEEELKEKRESLMKIQLQNKMMTAEVDTLKENLQKSELEKMELSRKVDVFEAKQRHTSMYHNEILKRDNHLRNFIASLNETAAKLQSEHVQAIELSKKTQLAKETLEKLKVCVEENGKLKKEKEKFEEMYVRTNAKYEKLEEIMSVNSIVRQPNLLAKVAFNQWKLNTSHYDSQMKQRDETLTKITKSFAIENTINIKLIKENENLKEANKKTEEQNCKLKDTCKENSETIKVLNERIKLLEEKVLASENEKSIQSEECINIVKDEPVTAIND